MQPRRFAVVLSVVAIAGGVDACSRTRCCVPHGAAPTLADAAPVPKPGEPLRLATVNWRVVQGPREAIVAAFGPGLDDGQFHARSLTLDEAARIQRGLEKDPGVRILSAPRVTVFEGKDGHIAIVNEMSYVSDFEIGKAGDSAVADPVVSVVSEGFDADFTVDRAEAGPNYLLALKLHTRRVGRPIPDETISVAGGTKPLRVQRPIVSVQGIETRVSLADGGSVLLGSMDAAVGEFSGPLLVWVSVEDAGQVSDGDPDLYLAPSNFRPPQDPPHAAPPR